MEKPKPSPWRVLFVERRLPWRVKVCLRWLWKRGLLVGMNLRRRRPFWRWSNLRSLHRMLDPGRVRPGSVPVAINSFNRLETLRTELEWILSLDGEPSVIVLDNASTYPPLLDYYRTLRHPRVQVVFLGYNSGLEGIEDISRELKRYGRYVVTDPDLTPYPDTPSDILTRMHEALDRFPRYNIVGASMEIDDIPESYPLRDAVREWERRYWPPQAEVVGEGLFDGWVDTTFGMYRPEADVTRIEPALRMDRPYRLRHADWYLDPENLTEEQAFYQRVCTPVGSWNAKLKYGDDLAGVTSPARLYPRAEG